MHGSRGGGRGYRHPLPEKSQSCNTGPDPLKKQYIYQASIQCWAIIGPPAKRHLNGVWLADRWWPAFSCINWSPLKTTWNNLSSVDGAHSKGLFRRHDFVSLTKSYMILSCMIFLFRRHYNVMCDFFQQWIKLAGHLKLSHHALHLLHCYS